MEFFRIHRDIPFMRHALVLNVISAVMFLAAVFFIVTRGLHFSIEFTGGTVVEVAYAQSADINKVRETVEGMGFGEVQVQNFGTSRDVLIRLPLRGDVKQTAVVSRVFTGLCRPKVVRSNRRRSRWRATRPPSSSAPRVPSGRWSCRAARWWARRWAVSWRSTAPRRWPS